MNASAEREPARHKQAVRQGISGRGSARQAYGFILAAVVLIGGCHDDRHQERLTAAGANPTIDELMRVADADAGATKFRQCTACHSDTDGATDRGGPNLFGVYGKPLGTNSASFGYTAALRDTGGRWDVPTLDRWISNPKQMIPGTSMQFPGVDDKLDRADIISYLRRQSEATNP